MNITVLTNHDAASALALHYLQASLLKHKISAFHTDKPVAMAQVPSELQQLATFEKMLPTLDNAFTALRSQTLNTINQEPDFTRFTQTKPELVISLRHMSILKQAVISTPRYGVINLHSGLLPSYQGVMATFWAMRNNDKYIGTTLHSIDDATIDTGRIINQTKTQVDYEKSYLWNTLSLYKDGIDLVIEAISAIESGKPLPAADQHGAAKYYSFPTSSDINQASFSLFDQTDSIQSFLSV